MHRLYMSAFLATAFMGFLFVRSAIAERQEMICESVINKDQEGDQYRESLPLDLDKLLAPTENESAMGFACLPGLDCWCLYVTKSLYNNTRKPWDLKRFARIGRTFKDRAYPCLPNCTCDCPLELEDRSWLIAEDSTYCRVGLDFPFDPERPF